MTTMYAQHMEEKQNKPRIILNNNQNAVYMHCHDIEPWEHNQTHDIHSLEELKEYAKTIDPIIYRNRSFHDGNHRINTLKMFNILIPVIMDNVLDTEYRIYGRDYKLIKKEK